MKKLRILQVSGEYYQVNSGGIGRHVADLSKHLSSMGHGVEVVASRKSRHNKIREGSVIVHNVQFSKVPVYRALEWSLKASYLVSKLKDFDVVHVHMPTAMIYPLLHSKIPMIVTFHSTGALLGNPLLKFIEGVKDRSCARKAKIFTSISPEVMYSLGGKILVSNGVEVNKYKKKKFNETLNLLFVGRLEKIKGVEDLVLAANLLESRHPGKYKFIIAGEGSLRTKLNRIAGKNIRLTGYLDKNRLDEYYKKSDIFILPSLKESMPCALLEAMAHGLPVITTDIPSLKHVVSDSFSRVVPPGSPVLIANAVEAISLPEVLNKMSVNSYKESRNYDWKKISRQYLDLYIEILR
jgi:glycosyltransferase involved in cell wall biosynthesis